MAGYSWEQGMSNNAVSAYENGLAPASVWARRLSVSSKEIKASCEPSEWHHSSKFFNRVNFFSWEDIVAGLFDALQPTTPDRRRLWLRIRHEAAARDLPIDDGSGYYVYLEALQGLS